MASWARRPKTSVGLLADTVSECIAEPLCSLIDDLFFPIPPIKGMIGSRNDELLLCPWEGVVIQVRVGYRYRGIFVTVDDQGGTLMLSCPC
jgi:hypothetical protein